MVLESSFWREGGTAEQDLLFRTMLSPKSDFLQNDLVSKTLRSPELALQNLCSLQNLFSSCAKEIGEAKSKKRPASEVFESFGSQRQRLSDLDFYNE
jgi:hypothetical protein